MTSPPRPDQGPAAAGDPGEAGGAGTPPPPRPEGLWRPDTERDGATGSRPRAARRLRAGCWVLIVVLLLICCVLSAWLADAVLDLRAVTTGG